MSGGDAGSLKRRLEGWREMVLLSDSVLSWEKEWYPAVTSGSLTALFLVVWYMDPSMLTLMSVCGLVMTLLDYIIPKVVASVFSEDSWTSEKEKKLEQICQEMMFVRTGLGRVCEGMGAYRETSPLIYLSSVVVSLYMLAHLGALFSGFFLAYLSLLALSMLPGLHRRGLLEKYCAGIILKIGEFVKAKKLE